MQQSMVQANGQMMQVRQVRLSEANLKARQATAAERERKTSSDLAKEIRAERISRQLRFNRR